MERWKVIGMLKNNGEYSDCICMNSKGQAFTIDFLVDGAFPEGTKSTDLLNKEIECDYTLPSALIAVAPRIIGGL